MNKYKESLKYIILFIIFLVVLILFGSNNTDNIWNYGMAHAIRNFELPYKDFNIISTPLYAFIMSIGLFIHDSYLVFLLEQALLCTVLIYFIKKIINNKYILMIPIMFFPIFYFLFPNYNFLVFLLLVIIIYLEKNEKSDYLIGFILGLIFLTKHTSGVMILLFSLLSTRSLKRGMKRISTFLVPVILFIIYLIGTKTFTYFIDLSILGLFDFSKSNGYFSIILILITLAIFIYTVYCIYKDRSNVYNYYILGALCFVVPICDMFHVLYLIVFFILIKFINIEIDNKKLFNIISLTCSLIIFILNIIINYNLIFNGKLLNKSYFDSYLVNNNLNNYIEDISSKYKSYDRSYMLSMSSMFFDILGDRDITYFDIPLYGNFGYNGINKMKKNISSLHDVYFFISDNDNRQYVNNLNDFIRKKGTYIESIYDYEIYYLE